MPTQGAVQTVQSTPVRSYTARIALSRPDRATLPPSKPPTQSDLAGLQPLCLDEPALGRPGRSRALYMACTGFNFALQTANLHALRAGRNAPPFPGEERGARSEERGAGSGERGARRPGEEWALRGVCSRFKFALAVPIQTPCNIATSPRPSHATLAGPHALVAQTSRLRPRPPTRPRPSNPRTLRMSSGSMTMG
jgi:hypothetical protein